MVGRSGRWLVSGGSQTLPVGRGDQRRGCPHSLTLMDWEIQTRHTYLAMLTRQYRHHVSMPLE